MLAGLASLAAGPAAQAPAENPAGPLTLEGAIRVALLQNPDLAAFDWGRRAAEARQMHAARRPNPTASVFAEDLGSSALAGLQPQVTIQLGHLVELGGKRASRLALAERNLDISTIEYEAARLDVLTRVGEEFRRVVGQQAALALAERALALAVEVERTVRERVAAGAVSPIEQTRAGLLVAAAERDLSTVRHALVGGRRRLAFTWGAGEPRFDRAVGDLAALPSVPPLEVLDQALAGTPAIARWTAEVERRQAALAQSRSARVPDLTLTAGYRRFTTTGANAAIVGGTVDLPWFSRSRDAIAAAEADVARARAEGEAAHLALRAALASAHAALLGARDAITILRTNVLTAARGAYEAVREGYQLGRFGLMEVLDAQRALASAEREHLDALLNFHAAAAAIERLTGQPLPPVPGAGLD
jgi:cobalt-zinc-cadmium efflux system outer membrane protein